MSERERRGRREKLKAQAAAMPNIGAAPKTRRVAKPKGNSRGSSSDARGPIVVPTRWVKMIAGVLLIPACWVLSSAFFKEFARVAIGGAFWATEEFYFFGLGALLWCIAFFGLPRPLWLYVFGHEATHALWVWLHGGKVREFKVASDGGYIVTDKTNFWIALAPYFFPLYSIALVGLWAIAGAFFDLWPYHRWLYAGVGVTWGFHATFMVSMIKRGQSDLTMHGTFFSLVVIYLVNLIVLSFMLVLACPDVTGMEFIQRVVYDAVRFSTKIRALTGWW